MELNQVTFKHAEIKRIYPLFVNLKLISPLILDAYKVTHKDEELSKENIKAIYKNFIEKQVLLNEQEMVFSLLEIYNYNIQLIEKTINSGLNIAKEQNLPEDYEFTFEKNNKEDLVKLAEELNIDSKSFYSKLSEFSLNNEIYNWFEPGSQEELDLLEKMKEIFTKDEIKLAFKVLLKRFPA